jgi:hypothetical protein
MRSWRRSKVDATVKAPPAEAEARLGAGGVLWVEDESVDAGMFLIVCLSRRLRCHEDPPVALGRPVVERAQLTLLARAYQRPDEEELHDITEIHGPIGSFGWQ